jgi:hypothetical protein
MFAAAVAMAILGIGGCGDNARPVVGQIMFTNASGIAQPTVTSLLHGTAVYLDVIVSDDPESLGIDWTVTCSSSLPEGSLPAGTVDTSCGSFAPYHTISGPFPNYPVTGIVTLFTAPASVPKSGTVTIVAHSTSLPSSVSSLTLTIM